MSRRYIGGMKNVVLFLRMRYSVLLYSRVPRRSCAWIRRDTMDAARLKSMSSLSPLLPFFPPYSVALRKCDFQYSRLVFFLVLYIVAGRLLQPILCPSRRHPLVGCHHLQSTTQDSLCRIVASPHTSSSLTSFLLRGSHTLYYLSFLSHSASNFLRIRHRQL